MKQCIKTNGVLFFFCLISLIITAQEQSVQSNIKCLNYPSSFELLLRHFKGKIVYIDVMASWCKPCLAELKEYEKTDDFFKKNDIVRLFISIDEPKDWNACLKRLDERLLNGYFVIDQRIVLRIINFLLKWRSCLSLMMRKVISPGFQFLSLLLLIGRELL